MSPLRLLRLTTLSSVMLASTSVASEPMVARADAPPSTDVKQVPATTPFDEHGKTESLVITGSPNMSAALEPQAGSDSIVVSVSVKRVTYWAALSLLVTQIIIALLRHTKRRVVHRLPTSVYILISMLWAWVASLAGNMAWPGTLAVFFITLVPKLVSDVADELRRVEEEDHA